MTRVVTQVFGAVPAEQGWSPALNCYESAGALFVCVDLAGVERESIEVSVQPGRLMIRGQRATPQPERGTPQRIHCMEIDAGPFERALALPTAVDLDRVTSRYHDGLLWIELPLQH
ncbi:MAG: Hsp20/alpha crystallin family protein [Phycisphaerales bacterium JB063]